jgi:hypothetical protein
MGKNLRTEKALIDSGAYVPGDFEDAPLVMKQAEKPARGIGKQRTQAEIDAKQAIEKPRVEQNYQAWKNKRQK